MSGPGRGPSQIDTLEPLQPDEDGVVLDVGERPARIVDRALASLGLPGAHLTVVDLAATTRRK